MTRSVRIDTTTVVEPDTIGNVLRQKNRAVHIDIVEQWQKLSDCRDPNGRFGHAADHDFQVEPAGVGDHPSRGRKAAAFDELDVDALEHSGATCDVVFDDAAFVRNDRTGEGPQAKARHAAQRP